MDKKKLISAAVAVLMTFSSTGTLAKGGYVLNDSFENLNNWNVVTGDAKVTSQELNVIADKSATMLNSGELNLTEKFSSSINFTANFTMMAKNEIVISDGTNVIVPLTVKKMEITPFDGATINPVKLVPGTEYNVVFATDAVAKTGKMWLNGELIFDRAIDISSKMDFSKAKISVRNASKREASLFKLNDIKVANSATGEFTSYPENNQSMVNTENLNAVKLDFGTIISPVISDNITVTESNIDGANSVSKTFTVKATDTGADVVVDGLVANKKYTVNTQNVNDAIGNAIDNQTISFTTAAGDYQAATVTATPKKAEVFEGESTEVDLSVTKGSNDIKSIEVYLNGVCVKQFAPTQDGKYLFTTNKLNAAGTYTYTVKVIDSIDGASTQDFSINVSANDKTNIDINVLDNETLAFPFNITLDLNDSDNVANTKLYIGNEIVLDENNAAATAHYEYKIATAPFSGDSVIKVVVTDGKGDETTLTRNVRFTADVLYSHDVITFDDYTKTGMPNEFWGRTGDGYARPEKDDEEHGTVLAFGATKEPKYDLFIQHNTKSVSGGKKFSTLGVEFDLKIIGNSSNLYVGFIGKGGTVKDDGVNPRFGSVDDKNILYGVIGQDKRHPYVMNEWKKVKIELHDDGVRSKYSMWYDGVKIVDHDPTPVNISDPDCIRFKYRWGNGSNAKILIDNYRPYGTYQAASITAIENENGACDKVEYSANKIWFKVNTDLKADLVNLNTVKLTDINNKPVELTEAKWNADRKAIEVTLKDKMFTNSEYIVTVDKTVTGAAMAKKFMTSSLDTDLLSYDFMVNGKVQSNSPLYAGDKVSAKVNLTSRTVSKDVRVIITTWEGDRMVDINVTPSFIDAGTSKEITTGSVVVNDSSNTKVRVYIWDSFTSMNPFVNRILEY